MPEKVFDKFCICADSTVCTENLFVCKCRIERPLNKVQAYIETEYGDLQKCVLSDLFDDRLSATQALLYLLDGKCDEVSRELEHWDQHPASIDNGGKK